MSLCLAVLAVIHAGLAAQKHFDLNLLYDTLHFNIGYALLIDDLL